MTSAPNYDPVAVILARVETKLDNALADLARHGSTLDRHDSILGEHGNRITAIETATATLPAQIDALEKELADRPTRAALNAALGVAAAFLATLITLLATIWH